MLARTRTERDWYNLLATQSHEAIQTKAGLDQNYASTHEWVHKVGGLENTAAMCAEYALQGGITKGFFEKLNDIHPRALMLLSKYGSGFRSMSWDFEVEPTAGACFGNALIQMRVFNQKKRKENAPERMEYVEEMAWASDHAIHHAWNAATHWDDFALDWTWYAFAGWGTYFGISLTQRQHAILRRLAYPEGDLQLLFTREVFPNIEKTLTGMLEQRHAHQQLKLKKLLIVPDRDF